MQAGSAPNTQQNHAHQLNRATVMPQYSHFGDCPVCNLPYSQSAPHFTMDAHHLRCHNCGDHLLTNSALGCLRGESVTEDERALRAHRVFKTAPDDLLDSDELRAMASVGQLPSAAECIDNLVLYLAGNQRPGELFHINPRFLMAALGVVSRQAAIWAIGEAATAGWVQSSELDDEMSELVDVALRLTARGWERHGQLMRDGAGSRHAFMAMDFKASDIREFFEEHLVQGVERTGFELRTTEHAQKTAGLIDARMRVELHTSRFVVCDLTHNNRGAYWEAGFAEGIGRPVFYLCRHDVLASQAPETRPHFDIAHQAIVKWDPNNPQVAVDELVAMIRATLPGEATMQDA